MNKIKAYTETGKLMGTYEVPNQEDMVTRVKHFTAFEHTDKDRDFTWDQEESFLPEYDLIGVNLHLQGITLVETRLYCKKGHYTYTEEKAA